jgi:hypothetical protein
MAIFTVYQGRKAWDKYLIEAETPKLAAESLRNEVLLPEESDVPAVFDTMDAHIDEIIVIHDTENDPYGFAVILAKIEA